MNHRLYGMQIRANMMYPFINYPQPESLKEAIKPKPEPTENPPTDQ